MCDASLVNGCEGVALRRMAISLSSRAQVPRARNQKMSMSMMKTAELTLVVLSLCAGCATTGDGTDESEPTVIDEGTAPVEAIEEAPPADEGASKQQEGEVPLTVAESEQPDQAAEEVVVQGRNLQRHEVIHDLVAEAQTLLRDVELQYVFTGKG